VRGEWERVRAERARVVEAGKGGVGKVGGVAGVAGVPVPPVAVATQGETAVVIRLRELEQVSAQQLSAQQQKLERAEEKGKALLRRCVDLEGRLEECEEEWQEMKEEVGRKEAEAEGARKRVAEVEAALQAAVEKEGTLAERVGRFARAARRVLGVDGGDGEVEELVRRLEALPALRAWAEGEVKRATREAEEITERARDEVRMLQGRLEVAEEAQERLRQRTEALVMMRAKGDGGVSEEARAALEGRAREAEARAEGLRKRAEEAAGRLAELERGYREVCDELRAKNVVLRAAAKARRVLLKGADGDMMGAAVAGGSNVSNVSNVGGFGSHATVSHATFSPPPQAPAWLERWAALMGQAARLQREALAAAAATVAAGDRDHGGGAFGDERDSTGAALARAVLREQARIGDGLVRLGRSVERREDEEEGAKAATVQRRLRDVGAEIDRARDRVLGTA
jgi:septal ring factor EnvC (AmiA/AmiB activator)